MIGLIHAILFEMIDSLAGSDGVLEVKRRAGVGDDKVFQIDEAYDDPEWRRLLGAACEVLGVGPAEAEAAYADFFIRDAQERWPAWFARSRTAREFLERQPQIHNSFATSLLIPAMRQDVTDKFTIVRQPSGFLMKYASPNRICGLYVALARSLMKHYGDHATIEELHCQKSGDPACEIQVTWPAMGAP
ncbi:MAG: heme NO-binding domain-containing protein [Planctomycetes bacterium]|nr:heme NO-binding domain-containing protein [Planctomycetota bacterium]